jgi:predicted TPR repeat methyltransferase
MSNNDIAEINRKAWNKVVREGRIIHPTKGQKEEKLTKLFMASLPKGGKVLDLGCGTGIPIGKRLQKAGFRVVGVDYADEMVKEFQKNLPDSLVLRILMTDIKWKEEFEGIISSFSLLCLPPKEFIQMPNKIIHALKKGGYFLLFLNEGDSKSGGVYKVQGQKMYTTGVSEKEIRDAFEANNFKIIKLEKETVVSKEYGKENTMLFLMRKNAA